MLNKVVIMGRLTADPELRQTPNGISVSQFTVAVQRSFGGKDGADRQSDFIPVVAWRERADFITKYFHKGSMICIEGTLQTRTYQDTRHPEVRHYVMEVLVDQAHFTGEKANGGQAGGYQQNNAYGASYSAPAQNGYSAPQTQTQSAAVSVGNFDDFEEIGADENSLPF